MQNYVILSNNNTEYFIQKMDVKKSLFDNLQTFFGFDNFKGDQEAIITNILEGNNTFVIMPTGGGKSICYQLPALMSEGTAIVISPLIALMKNQVDQLRAFGGSDSIAHFMNSSLNKTEITQVKSDLLDGQTKLLYVAPESLAKQENIEFLKLLKISFVAVDEAHCISEWGHDFRPEYRKIRQVITGLGEHIPIIALTATATPKVQQDIVKNLQMTDATLFKSSFNRPNLFYEIRPKRDVIKEIIRYIKYNTGKSGIIYCLSRKKVEEVAEALNLNGIKALPYHAGLEPKVRAETQDQFLMEDAHNVVKRLKSQDEGNYKVDLSKSALSLERTKAFPKNVEFEALLTFDGDAKGRNIRSVTPTASLLSVIQHHSFVELPDDIEKIGPENIKEDTQLKKALEIVKSKIK